MSNHPKGTAIFLCPTCGSEFSAPGYWCAPGQQVMCSACGSIWGTRYAEDASGRGSVWLHGLVIRVTPEGAARG